MESDRTRFAMFAVLVAGCASEGPSLADDACPAVVWARPQRAGAALTVAGSWDEWERPRPMRSFEGGWRLAELALPPGEYGYVVIEESKGRLDTYNPLTTYRASDDQEVSLLQVRDCSRPQLVIDSVDEVQPGTLQVEAWFEPARSGAPIDPAAVHAEAQVGTLDVSVVDPANGILRVQLHDAPPGKHTIELRAHDSDDVATGPVRAAGWVQPEASSTADTIIYQVMIDRFRADEGTVLDSPPNPGARAGGTLDGVRSELERGTFDALGVSTLWLSPVYTNPDDARPGIDGQLYEGYHGYWPLHSRQVDPRIGGDSALHALVETAHDRGVRVLLDLVPNHYYEANPRVAEYRPDAWFHEHDPACVCGTPSCPWNGYIEVCWFTDYLPDVRFEHPEAMATAIDDARWWLETFDVDGFRIDAVPMMPRSATRRIVDMMRSLAQPRTGTLHLGEIFTGPGRGGTEAIRYHLGPDGLDSAFDFPLMWALREALAHDGAGFDAIDQLMSQTEHALQGSGSVMARIVGNHDTTRFISEAHGDAARDPWGPIVAAQPTVAESYQRHRLALGLLFTLPGIPVLYYGDEVGLAGGADPDSRRVMPALEGLGDLQGRLLEDVRRLGTLRRCSPALRRGRRVPFAISSDTYGFVRDAEDGAPAFVLITRSAEPQSPTVAASVATLFAMPGEFVDVLTGETFHLGDADTTIALAPRSIRVLVPVGHPCA